MIRDPRNGMYMHSSGKVGWYDDPTKPELIVKVGRMAKTIEACDEKSTRCHFYFADEDGDNAGKIVAEVLIHCTDGESHCYPVPLSDEQRKSLEPMFSELHKRAVEKWEKT